MCNTGKFDILSKMILFNWIYIPVMKRIYKVVMYTLTTRKKDVAEQLNGKEGTSRVGSSIISPTATCIDVTNPMEIDRDQNPDIDPSATDTPKTRYTDWFMRISRPSVTNALWKPNYYVDYFFKLEYQKKRKENSFVAKDEITAEIDRSGGLPEHYSLRQMAFSNLLNVKQRITKICCTFSNLMKIDDDYILLCAETGKKSRSCWNFFNENLKAPIKWYLNWSSQALRDVQRIFCISPVIRLDSNEDVAEPLPSPPDEANTLNDASLQNPSVLGEITPNLDIMAGLVETDFTDIHTDVVVPTNSGNSGLRPDQRFGTYDIVPSNSVNSGLQQDDDVVALNGTNSGLEQDDDVVALNGTNSGLEQDDDVVPSNVNSGLQQDDDVVALNGTNSGLEQDDDVHVVAINGTNSGLEQDELRRLREEYRGLVKETLCKICLQNKMCIVFMDCGHMTCSECAPQCRICPFCRGQIVRSVQVRM